MGRFAAEIVEVFTSAYADVARHFAVGDAFHLQMVQAGEVGDLLEG